MIRQFITLLASGAAFGILWVTVCHAVEGGGAKAIGQGEEPEKVYLRYFEAKRRLDTLAVSSLTSRRVAKKDGLYERLMRERSSLPDRIEFVHKKSEERIAQVLFRGTRRDRESDKLVTSRGTIQLLEEDGAWRVFKEKWEDMKEEDYVPSSPGHDRYLPPLVPKESRLPRREKKAEKESSK